MPTVRYDDRSYLVDDRRIWLSSGSIHYFRVPQGLWRDRLLKAKRAGLNCIQTYVAWNFHELTEGQWNFSGDRDVANFIIQAAELGLYVTLRPGPYICAEWDFGGFPGWLEAKSGIAYRTVNAAYTHYFDKYLGQLLARLADLQVTRGGNIILIQNENEYCYTAMPDRLNYCQFINQLFRRAGFDIPIITCNWCTQPQIPETVECYNGWDRNIQGIKRLRAMQPQAPLLATEFWPGWFDYWGGTHQTRDAREVARRALEILGCGCQVNYYMWHGGTNFGFWGSRLTAGEATYQTTSYDYDAPLAEGGGLTEKYYLTKLVNMLAKHFGHVLAAAQADEPSVTVHSGTEALNLSGPAGRIAVVTNNGRSDIATADISLPDGTDLTVSLEPLGAVAVPIDVRLPGERLLNYANLMPLGLFGEGTLVLHGPPGWEGRIAIDGDETRRAVPHGDEPELFEHRGQRIILVNSRTAQHTWEVDGSLVVGPEYVGATIEDAVLARGAGQYAIISPQGELTHRKVRPVRSRAASVPRLKPFARVCVCDEPINPLLRWQKQDGPRSLAAVGIPYGYGWFRVEVEVDQAGRRWLYLPECEDRAQVYVNGQWIGTWGRGADASRKPISVNLRKGRNVLTFLTDNLGRFNSGPDLGAEKGLYGHVWSAQPVRLGKLKITRGGQFTRRMVPRMLTHLVKALETEPYWTTEVTFRLPRICPVHLSYAEIPRHVLVLCNGRQAAFLPHSGGFGDVRLGNELKKGLNSLTLLLWGGAPPKKDLENVRLHLLTENLSQRASWSHRRLEMPAAGGRLVGKQLPAWYRATFQAEPDTQGLFLRLAGAKKGQIFLNGQNVGRFWSIGPQEHYYLPESWLRAENELLVFEEQGSIPSGSRLVIRPRGPYRD